MSYLTKPSVLFVGAGNFVRGFCCELISRAAENQNPSSPALGRVVTMQRSSKPQEMRVVRDFQVLKEPFDRLEVFANGGMRNVRILGVQDGVEIDEVREIHCIDRMLAADQDWPELLHLARSKSLEWIVSNGSEGALKEIGEDKLPKQTHFGKLTLLLLERFTVHGSPLQVIATELTPENGSKVRKAVLDIAEKFESDAFVEWLEKCRFRSSLVDRIIPGLDGDHPEFVNDPGLILAEPYGYWSIETQQGDPKFIDHPFVAHKPDISLDVRRKLFFLNCSHTAMVQRWMTEGRTPEDLTVRQAVTTHGWKPWLQKILDEVLLTFDDKYNESMSTFAAQVMERYIGPISQMHLLSSIATNHGTKLIERIQPVVDALPQDFENSILRQVLEWSKSNKWPKN